MKSLKGDFATMMIIAENKANFQSQLNFSLCAFGTSDGNFLFLQNGRIFLTIRVHFPHSMCISWNDDVLSRKAIMTTTAAAGWGECDGEKLLCWRIVARRWNEKINNELIVELKLCNEMYLKRCRMRTTWRRVFFVATFETFFCRNFK